MRTIVACMSLASIGFGMATPGQGSWCAKSHDSIQKNHSYNFLDQRVSFRGEYKEFSLFVEASELMADCAVFKDHVLGDDGLWVIEEPDAAALEKTKKKLEAAGFPIYFLQELSFVVGGGSDVPNVAGLDGCGADEDTSFIPVASHSISPPELSVNILAEWRTENLQLNPDVVTGVALVSENTLTQTISTLQSFYTRNSYSETIVEAQSYLVEALESYGFTVELFSHRSDMASNIIATWSSNDATEWIVAGAHYDSRSTNSSSGVDRAPGADDNASGSSAMLQLASIISELKYDLTRGLKICFFTGEEQGLLGSRALASKWKQEEMNIIAMVNADMLGYQAGTEITLGFKDKSVTPELVTLAKELTALYVPSLPTADSSSCCSDYLAFWENGFPCVGFFESGMAASAYPAYHTINDLIVNVNTEQLKLETQAVVATVLTLLLE